MTTDSGLDSSPSEAEILSRLEAFVAGEEPLETTLQTDERVIARVTDGIYRQPSSALRELISNAYDADATRVNIGTDRPRFGRIQVEDDGVGMSTQTLVRLIYHIGGSSKRTAEGGLIGVASAVDPDRSPGGRPLIGKIGIGLFSVAQLTQAFQVITKRKGDDHRTIASVLMRQYSEHAEMDGGAPKKYSAGRVRIWKEPALDIEAHGTTVILDSMRPQTRDTLRSRGTWQAVLRTVDSKEDAQDKTEVRPPLFHIGTVTEADDSLLEQTEGRARYPWDRESSPKEKFASLVNSVWGSIANGVPNPNLDQIFDYYLKMVWQLSLWAPLNYVDTHPFDVKQDSGIKVYGLAREGVIRIGSTVDRSAREEMGLVAGSDQKNLPFQVTIDDLEISRPIKLHDLPASSGALKTPLLFAGKHRESFQGVDPRMSGGVLDFEAYILWAPKLAPAQHHGIIVRVHNATGSIYDESFMKFPVAEQRRMTQLTCEIFVKEGFDGALNIDRESFNFAHPHVIVLTRWVHSAIRRVISEQKRLARAALADRRADGQRGQLAAVEEVVRETWFREHGEDGTEPPGVTFSDDPNVKPPYGYALPRTAVLGTFQGANSAGREAQAEAGVAGILGLLAAYNLLDELEPHEIPELAKSLRLVLEAMGK